MRHDSIGLTERSPSPVNATPSGPCANSSLAAQRLPQSFERPRPELSGLPMDPPRDAVVGDRLPNGLRVVVVGRSSEGDDVVVVCDLHPHDLWFSGVLPLEDAAGVVCQRCLEERRLRARRALVLDGYGRAAWLRVLGK